MTTSTEQAAPEDKIDVGQLLMASREMGWALEQILAKFDADPEGCKQSLEEVLKAHAEFHGVLRVLAPRIS